MLHWFVKRLKEAKKDQKGFTLIELLVVVVIIGILAAIAIPTFLNQRDKAQDADAQSTLRNAGTAQQAYMVDNGTYATAKGPVSGANNDLADYGFNDSASAPLNIVGADKDSYCMSAESQSGTTYYLNSGKGVVGTTSCSGSGTA